ncbi:MAG: Crp/Fnr family transcriptional regulator [Candidatus Marinimicrobia bacterium]|nr:Crp/Fnr family transcriptional regulator [Candidatus Neomarinimicrobiota bacterium]|tara:strand:+ start:3612 stop:4286 length:675 start_codon:yes stop_codon:yes gene_type:complete
MIDFLSNVSIFSELSNNELEKIQKFFKVTDYPKGSMVILEEEFGDTVFIIKKGTVKITRVNDEGKEVILSLMGEYEVFGEMSVLDGEARSANVLAQEDCELLSIRSEDFLGLLKENFKISYELLAQLAKRLRKSDMRIEALSLSDAEHRIGVSILSLAEEMGVIRKGKVTIENLPFQQDIANMSGTSRETVSRILRLFEDRNILNKNGHKLVIPDYNHFKRFFS